MGIGSGKTIHNISSKVDCLLFSRDRKTVYAVAARRSWVPLKVCVTKEVEACISAGSEAGGQSPASGLVFEA